MPRRDPSELEHVNLLALAPVRCASWEERGLRAILLRPRPRRQGLRTPLEWLVYLMAPKRLRLDQVGSFVWRRLDGSMSVGEIAVRLRSEFGLEAEPVEERLGHFIRLLRREGLLAFPSWDEVPENAPGPTPVEQRISDPDPS